MAVELCVGGKNLIVLGDFNDCPSSPHLQPRLANTNLKDVSTDPSFTQDGLDGTFGRGSPKESSTTYVRTSPVE